ncbi:hypothetical protein FACHB389_02910 [Nostoc calcicola FACHB-389]|nr:hypothetical protein FACHB389_02910 [Nostoc calcicola FACHB-389]
MGHWAFIRPLAKVLFATGGKRVKVKGEGNNTELFPLPPAPYPQRGPHLPLFPTYARSLLVVGHWSFVISKEQMTNDK